MTQYISIPINPVAISQTINTNSICLLNNSNFKNACESQSQSRIAIELALQLFSFRQQCLIQLIQHKLVDSCNLPK